MDKKIDKGCPKKMEIKFYSRVIIFSPFYQVLGFKLRKGALFLGHPVYICIYAQLNKIFLPYIKH